LKNIVCIESDDVYKEDDSALLSLTKSNTQFKALSFNAWNFSPVNFITGDYLQADPSSSRLFIRVSSISTAQVQAERLFIDSISSRAYKLNTPAATEKRGYFAKLCWMSSKF
jgi:hypothetical protein